MSQLTRKFTLTGTKVTKNWSFLTFKALNTRFKFSGGSSKQQIAMKEAMKDVSSHRPIAD